MTRIKLSDSGFVSVGMIDEYGGRVEGMWPMSLTTFHLNTGSLLSYPLIYDFTSPFQLPLASPRDPAAHPHKLTRFYAPKVFPPSDVCFDMTKRTHEIVIFHCV